ncbi:MAG: hypothetical protein ABI759_11105 [Candidatus Solibacter sp.]
MAQARRYQEEGGSLAGNESSDEMSTMSRSGSSAISGAANAHAINPVPASPAPVSQSVRREEPAASSAVPRVAHINLEPWCKQGILSFDLSFGLIMQLLL